MVRMTVSAVEPFRVVFVCTGNICRSPMAEIVFREFAVSSGLRDRVGSTSAGTGDWHVGEGGPPHDRGAHPAGLRRGPAPGAAVHARRLRAQRPGGRPRPRHERILRGWARTEADADKIALLMSFDANARTLDVPDPYYAGPGMFDEVLGMIEARAGRSSSS